MPETDDKRKDIVLTMRNLINTLEPLLGNPVDEHLASKKMAELRDKLTAALKQDLRTDLYSRLMKFHQAADIVEYKGLGGYEQALALLGHDTNIVLALLVAKLRRAYASEKRGTILTEGTVHMETVEEINKEILAKLGY